MDPRRIMEREVIETIRQTSPAPEENRKARRAEKAKRRPDRKRQPFADKLGNIVGEAE